MACNDIDAKIATIGIVFGSGDTLFESHFHPKNEASEEWTLSRQQSSASRIYYGPGSEAIAFARRALGGILDPSGAVTYVPEYACHLATWLTAKSARIQFDGTPIIASNGEYEWPYATVTLEFQSSDRSQEGDEAYIRTSLKSANEALTIEGGTGVFASGQTIPVPIPLNMTCIEMRFEWERAPNLGYDLFSKAGKVNNATWRGLPAGTVLFTEYEASSQQKGMFSEEEFRRSYGLKYREVEHNKHFNIYTGNWEEVTFPGGRKTYLTADLSSVP